MNSILFVCLGNICRSPLAEGLAKKEADDRGLDLFIDSCGTGSWHVGEPPCSDSIRIAKSHGIDISKQRARQIRLEDFERFSLIVALDTNNYNDLISMGAHNVVKLGDYGFEGEDVPDPYFFPGYEGFDKVYNMIETSVKNLFNSLYTATS